MKRLGVVAIKPDLGLKDLIGKTCRLEFALPAIEWPISGFPAWVIIESVDMPLVKMCSSHGGSSVWVNAGLIKTISAEGIW